MTQLVTVVENKISALKKEILKTITEEFSQQLKEIPHYNYDSILNQLSTTLNLQILRNNFNEIKLFLEYEKTLKDLRTCVITKLINELYSGLTKSENVDRVNNLSAVLQDLANVCMKFATTINLKFNLELLINSFFDSAIAILHSDRKEIVQTE